MKKDPKRGGCRKGNFCGETKKGGGRGREEEGGGKKNREIKKERENIDDLSKQRGRIIPALHIQVDATQ